MPRRSTRQRKKVVYKDFETGSTSEEESDFEAPPPKKTVRKRKPQVVEEDAWDPGASESEDEYVEEESEEVVEKNNFDDDLFDDLEPEEIPKRSGRRTSRKPVKRKARKESYNPPKKRRRTSAPKPSIPSVSRRSSLPPSLPSLPNLDSQWESRELNDASRPDIPEEEPEDTGPLIVWLGKAEGDCVGVRYYNGIVTNKEATVLVREPRNAYDRNAIRVENQSGDQVGHINRHDAARLAPLMDQWPDFRIEAVVLRGANNTYKMTLTLNFFGRESYRDQVQGRCRFMTGYKLNMDIQAAPRFGKSKKAGKSESVILADLDQIFDSILPYSKMPEVKTPKHLLVTLYEHQRKALWWCLQREIRETVETALRKQERLNKKLTTVMCWRRGKSPGTYQNIATNFTTRTPPKLPCGGLLADDMGLGKTITSLALIQEQKNRGATGSTLIVLPLSIMRQWEETILTQAPDLTFIRYHGSDRVRSKAKLLEHDIVLTTYNLIGLECASKKTGPLPKIDWLRIVLDESHIIRNKKTKACVGICELKAHSRWCLTGTPMQNKVDDIYSQVKFLRIEPFREDSWWLRTITRPIRNRDKTGLERLCILMKSICLRRDKNMKVKLPGGKYRALITLPKCAQTVMHIKLPTKDRAIYEKWLKQGRELMNSTASVSFASMLLVLLRMRQACCHSELLPEGGKQEPNLDANQVAKLIDVLKNSGDEDCPICFESFVETKACITPCAHLFCIDCIHAHIKANKPNCPLCRGPVKICELVEQPPEDDEEASSVKGGSEKISGMIKYIEKVQKDEKVVVFSQFTKFLDMIQNSFEDEGIACVRLDGRMSIGKRMEAIRRFQNEDPEDSKVFLISLKAGGVGLNLVRANHVILADPWWNPATEDQAVDRVFRIGQTRNVCIVRMIVKDSIEDKILALHTKKRQMAKTLFSKSKKELKEIKLQEMKLMLE